MLEGGYLLWLFHAYLNLNTAISLPIIKAWLMLMMLGSALACKYLQCASITNRVVSGSRSNNIWCWLDGLTLNINVMCLYF